MRFSGKMRSVRRWVVVLALLAVAGGVYWHGSQRRPAGPDDGTEIHGEIAAEAPTGNTFRVATFNIHGCKGEDGRRDPKRIAACLEGMHLVGLNEVHGRRLGYGSDQAEILGQELGMAWLFAPAERRWYRDDFGNGLLTTMPVASWQRIPLAQRFDHSFRNALLATVEHEGQPIRVLITHITQRDDREREAQLRAALALFLALDEPAILLADLNSLAADPQIKGVLARPEVLDPVAEILGAEDKPRVDWILVRGLKAVDAGIMATEASDHPMVWAELEIPDEPGR